MIELIILYSDSIEYFPYYSGNYEIFTAKPEVLIMDGNAYGYKKFLKEWNLSTKEIKTSDSQLLTLLYHYEKINELDEEVNYVVNYSNKQYHIAELINDYEKTTTPIKFGCQSSNRLYYFDPVVVTILGVDRIAEYRNDKILINNKAKLNCDEYYNKIKPDYVEKAINCGFGYKEILLITKVNDNRECCLIL